MLGSVKNLGQGQPEQVTFNQSTMDHYSRYIDTHPLVLDKLEQTLHKNAKFEQVYR